MPPQHVKFWKNPWKNSGHTHKCLHRKQVLNWRNPHGEENSRILYKMDLQSTEYITTCLSLFLRCNSRSWHVQICLQSQYVGFPCFKESLTLRRLCFSYCRNRGFHLPLDGCVTLRRSSLNSVLWSHIDLCRSPSISIDLPLFWLNFCLL